MSSLIAPSKAFTHVSPRAPERETRRPLRVVGLFAGIGGIELGLQRSGHHSHLLCEIDEAAQLVLKKQFPGIEVVPDIRSIEVLPASDLVAAGFPCQDLSQAGRTAGIVGAQSSLVGEVLRLVANSDPTWLLLENVPFMLQLDRGRAMSFLVDSLEAIGFTWAYRIVDTRSFGLPQRRRRVVLLASRSEDPRRILFADNADEPEYAGEANAACGFYWTEGIRGLGWAVDGIPTLKGGSGLGIPSPPAIRLPHGRGIVLPSIRDAERFQGFPEDWTQEDTLTETRRRGSRWKMVGNAVSVPVAEWLGRRLAAPGDVIGDEEPLGDGKWPGSAWGRSAERFSVNINPWPVQVPYRHLADFLQHETRPLSERAARGFLSRTRRSTLHFPDGFIRDVEAHLERVRVSRQAFPGL